MLFVADSPTNGNVILVKPEQPLKAPRPMVVTLSGIVILVRFLQLEKALAPIDVIVIPLIEEGIISVCKSSLYFSFIDKTPVFDTMKASYKPQIVH